MGKAQVVDLEMSMEYRPDVEENVGLCVGDGDGPVFGAGDGPGVEAKVIVAVGCLVGDAEST